MSHHTPMSATVRGLAPSGNLFIIVIIFIFSSNFSLWSIYKIRKTIILGFILRFVALQPDVYIFFALTEWFYLIHQSLQVFTNENLTTNVVWAYGESSKKSLASVECFSISRYC